MENKHELTEVEFLQQYQPGNYEKPSVTVDMLIFTIAPEEQEPELELLLIKRKNHPFRGCWALPGGFVEIDETIDAAASRELYEETGLSDLYMEQLYTFGAVQRDPRMRVISVSYMALVSREQLHPVAGDDAAECGWFRVRYNTSQQQLILSHQDQDIQMIYSLTAKAGGWQTTLDQQSQHRLAFDHAMIITTALERMRNKVEYTPIAFYLVPPLFTMPELQKVYEAILDRKLQKASFRRKVAALVEATGMEKVVPGVIRNAQYYRWKNDRRTSE